ncbi:unnamed protein product [Debaryomyces fabryi]|nr:unnamed protein product [Debaryomyces fabryi]
MLNVEIRLNDTFGSHTNWLDRVKYDWTKVDVVETLGYTEKKDLVSKTREEWTIKLQNKSK